jgi:hypothetical protein
MARTRTAAASRGIPLVERGSLQANPGSGSAAKRHVHHVFRTFAEEVMFYEANRARRAPVHRTTTT